MLLIINGFVPFKTHTWVCHSLGKCLNTLHTLAHLIFITTPLFFIFIFLILRITIIQLFYFIILILLFFKYSCLHFPPPLSPTPPTPTSHPQSCPPLALSMGPIYTFLGDRPHNLTVCFPTVAEGCFKELTTLLLAAILPVFVVDQRGSKVRTHSETNPSFLLNKATQV